MSMKILRQSLVIKLGLVILLLGAGFFLYYAFFWSSRVPGLAGLSLRDAKSKIRQAKLEAEVVKKFSAKESKGTVISQEPLAESRVKKGSEVTIIISKGRKPPRTSESKKPPRISKRPPPSPLNVPNPPAPNPPAVQAVVSIDPGHQARANLAKEPVGPGSSTTKEKVRGGSTGVASRTPEYKITLAIGLKLKPLLEAKGVKVVMIRETNDVNIPNSERAKLANQAKAQLFVRIHADGSENPATNGISTLHPAKNHWTEPIYSESLKAAQIVQEELIKATGAKDNGLKPRDDITGFNWSEVPVILPEVGFLSNPEDDRLLNSEAYQNKIAEGLANGILAYLSQD